MLERLCTIVKAGVEARIGSKKQLLIFRTHCLSVTYNLKSVLIIAFRSRRCWEKRVTSKSRVTSRVAAEDPTSTFADHLQAHFFRLPCLLTCEDL